MKATDYKRGDKVFVLTKVTSDTTFPYPMELNVMNIILDVARGRSNFTTLRLALGDGRLGDWYLIQNIAQDKEKFGTTNYYGDVYESLEALQDNTPINFCFPENILSDLSELSQRFGFEFGSECKNCAHVNLYYWDAEAKEVKSVKLIKYQLDFATNKLIWNKDELEEEYGSHIYFTEEDCIANHRHEIRKPFIIEYTDRYEANLTEDEAEEIRQRISDGELCADDLANKGFDVSYLGLEINEAN